MVVTIRGGTVDEIGTPTELARSGGIYDLLLKLQHGKDKEKTQKKLQSYDIAA